MKTLFIMLAFLAFTFTSCKQDEVDPTPKEFKIDPLQTVALRAEKANQTKSAIVGHLSPLEIVKQTTVIQYWYNGVMWERGFDVLQKDTSAIDPKLMMWADDIIRDGKYVPDFVESSNCLLLHFTMAESGLYKDIIKDTLAYIPNATLQAASIAIKTAFANQDQETCLRLFDEAFTFIPITSSEYNELEKKGLN